MTFEEWWADTGLEMAATATMRDVAKAAWGGGVRAAAPGGNAKPITIRGVTYPSVRQAARQLGVSEWTVYWHKRAGTLDRAGINKGSRNRAKPTVILGKEYSSRKEAADALGIAPNIIGSMIESGAMDAFALSVGHPDYRRKAAE